MGGWFQRICSFEHFESVEMAYPFLLKTIILPILEENADISLPKDNLCAIHHPLLSPLLATRSRTKVIRSGQQSGSGWSSGSGPSHCSKYQCSGTIAPASFYSQGVLGDPCSLCNQVALENSTKVVRHVETKSQHTPAGDMQNLIMELQVWLGKYCHEPKGLS